MNVSNEWGPPPPFVFTAVSPNGIIRRVRPNNQEVKARKSDKSSEECQDAIHEEEENHLTFYSVDGCPNASSELLVKEGEYEGGFSIWECTWDFFGFLQQANSKYNSEIKQKAKSGHVMELGCGHGLPGIWALQQGASAVVFQDLNARVLHTATKWNILKNLAKTEPPSRFACRLSVSSAAAESSDLCRLPSEEKKNEFNANEKKESFALMDARVLCVACKWEDMPDIFCSCQSQTEEKKKSIQFDLILCAEGVYREQCFEPFALLLLRHLAADGRAVVASKRYYFGIGGGSLVFMQFLDKNFKAHFIVEVASTLKGSNSNNFRDILVIRKRPQES